MLPGYVHLFHGGCYDIVRLFMSLSEVGPPRHGLLGLGSAARGLPTPGRESRGRGADAPAAAPRS